jgi:hypothetical protein
MLDMSCSLAKRGMRFPDENDPLAKKRLFYGNNGELIVGVLPVSIFASGHTFFVSRIFQQLKLNPYVVHATFQFSGTDGKRNRLREFMLWRDEPEYYEPGHAFVTWEMETPADMVALSVPNPPSLQCCTTQQGHFDLVNHQLLQTRHALAAASVSHASALHLLSLLLTQRKLFMYGKMQQRAPHSMLYHSSAVQYVDCSQVHVTHRQTATQPVGSPAGRHHSTVHRWDGQILGTTHGHHTRRRNSAALQGSY